MKCRRRQVDPQSVNHRGVNREHATPPLRVARTDRANVVDAQRLHHWIDGAEHPYTASSSTASASFEHSATACQFRWFAIQPSTSDHGTVRRLTAAHARRPSYSSSQNATPTRGGLDPNPDEVDLCGAIVAQIAETDCPALADLDPFRFDGRPWRHRTDVSCRLIAQSWPTVATPQRRQRRRAWPSPPSMASDRASAISGNPWRVPLTATPSATGATPVQRSGTTAVTRCSFAIQAATT